MSVIANHEALYYRPLTDADVPAYSRMLFDSFNTWWRRHGWDRDRFTCRPEDLSIYYEIYNDMSPGCSIAAFAPDGRIVGACFYHPREFHVSLGIMAVHADCGGRGIGRAMVEYILGYTREHGFPACRLVGSAMNMDSFSLYNRAGFVPRAVYHDMVINVPEHPAYAPVPGQERVRAATASDVAAMGALELEVSGIRREVDYRYAIANPRGVLHATVCEGVQGGIEGFLISIRHPAIRMIGPLVTRSEEAAVALIGADLPRFAGSRVLLVIPMDKRIIVEQCYAWGARNVETHLAQVWGAWRPINGVNIPSFLPETG